MLDRRISKRLKMKVLRAWCHNGMLNLEKVTLTGQQQHKLQVCGNNWVRMITTMRVERRRVHDLMKTLHCRAD